MLTQLKIQNILNFFNIPIKQIDIEKVINVYIYGSLIYSTNNENSDIDYIIIIDQDIDESETLYCKHDNTILNAKLYKKEFFQNKINEHDISTLECLFINDDLKYVNLNFDFNLDLIKLRKSISTISSNSWVKSKKKFIQNDNLIGYKSLFHSLRILDFGIQIATYGKIIDFKKSKSKTLNGISFLTLITDIKSFNDYDTLKNEYGKTYNNLKTEFKILTPKI